MEGGRGWAVVGEKVVEDSSVGRTGILEVPRAGDGGGARAQCGCYECDEG